ncbi:MAG: NUDIX hydrolase [Clostridia bacterium]
MSNFEKTISTEEIYNGKIIVLSRDKVKLQNGKTALREVVHHNGGACVLALDDDDNVFLVKQFRYPFNVELLELPAGKLEKGENPEHTAIRELEEECGLKATEIKSLGVLYPTVAYCTEIIYMYFATKFEPSKQNLDEDEFVDIVKLPLTEAIKMVINNEIPDAKTQVAILKVAVLKGISV